MVKTIFKYTLRVILIILGLALLLIVLLYLPPVQNFIKTRAVSYVYTNLGMELSVDKFRVRFPLNVRVDNTTLITPQGDTLARFENLRLGVALLPLLRREVEVRSISVKDAGVHFRDTVSNLDLRVNVKDLLLTGTDIGLGNKDMNIRTIDLSDGTVDLSLGESTEVDTTSNTLQWKIAADRINLDRVDFRMNMNPRTMEIFAGLEKGRIENTVVDLGRQDISAKSLIIDKGTCTLLMENVDAQEAAADVADSVAQSIPWTIRAGKVELNNGAFTLSTYDNRGGRPGFDPSHMVISEINARLDSVYNRRADVAGYIRELSFKERSGLEVEEANGHFSMDSSGIRLTDFSLRTPNSQIKADAYIGRSVSDKPSETPLSLIVDANLSMADVGLFTSFSPSVSRTFRGRTLSVAGNIEGNLNAININALDVTMPGHIVFTASGFVTSITNTKNLGGDIRFRGNFTNIGFMTGLLSPAMQNRIAFPRRMIMAGNIQMARRIYQPNVTISIDTARLDLRGRLDLNQEVYDMRLTMNDFPLMSFLPHDSLGLVTMQLNANGRFFDPRREGASADIKLNIERFDFRNFQYENITLDAAVANHVLTGKLSSDNEALKLYFDLNGELRPEKYAAHLAGKIINADLYKMGLSNNPFAISLDLDATLAASLPDTTYTAYLQTDTMKLSFGDRYEVITKTTVRASANPNAFTAAVRSGDFALDFKSPMSVNKFITDLGLTMKQVRQQIDSASLNMTDIQKVLPSFSLNANAGRKNIMNDILLRRGTTFNKMTVTAANDEDTPFYAYIVVNGFQTANLKFDSLNVGLLRKEDQLNFFVRMVNGPGSLERLALIYLYGNAVNNTANVNIVQTDKADSVGFRFGLDAKLLDSAVRVSIIPENPVLAYRKWTVNPDNYFTYHFTDGFDANIRLMGDGQHIIIQPATLKNIAQGAIKLDMEGINIGSAMNLIPSTPPVGGILSTDIIFGMNGKLIALEGDVAVDSMTYNSRRIGNVGLTASFQSDSVKRRLLDAHLTVDDTSVLTAKGTFTSEGDQNIDLKLDIPSLPLDFVNPFLPANIMQLEGAMRGDLTVTGSTSNLNIDGGVSFPNTKVNLVAAGTTFDVSPDQITVNESLLSFDNFTITAPNNQPLTIDGSIDLSDFSRIFADFDIFATDFAVVSSSNNRESMVFGNANLDVDIIARGPLDALQVRGDIYVLRGTDVTYTLRNSPLTRDQRQNIVTFMPFATDTLYLPMTDTTSRIRGRGMNMLVNVGLENNVSTTLNLSEDGNNRVELVGSGNLTYTVNAQNDVRFTGRYVLSGGTFVYNPPIISQRNFAIGDGSFVQWTGDIVNPSFDITATETIPASVNIDGGAATTVNFEVIVQFKNTLQDLALTFDLAAPGNIAIQNQLKSMTPEERSTQALMLMITNTYRGPGGTQGSVTNNPLNAFIQKELNSWARSSLPGVDLSFGLETGANIDGSQHTNYSYRVSKNLFNDRVKVTVGGTLNPGNNNSVDNLRNNFVDDIILEYRINDRDNMFLKVYRYNTQESILEGEIIETGVGFVVRKRMNHLGELLRFSRSPERKEERRQKKVIKQQLREEEKELGIDPAKEQRQTTPLELPEETTIQEEPQKNE